MQNPENLRVTTEARALALHVYDATSGFPDHERFGLIAQMRRAGMSIGSNIFEGCGRSGDRELAHFLHVALGSASELQFQAEMALDLGYLTSDSAGSLLQRIRGVKGMLARLIKALRRPAV